MHIAMESPALADFGAVVAAYLDRPFPSRRDGDLVKDLELKRSLINRLELDFARDAARFADTYDSDVHGNPGPVSWLRANCHMTSHAAATAVCVGEQAARLELSRQALAEGRLGFAHLGLMASTAEALDGCGARDRFDEVRLIHKAETLNVRRFRDLCSHVRHEADRDAFLAKQLEQREWRTLALAGYRDDGVAVSGFLDREGGAIVRTALEPLAGRTGRDDARPREQRYADALVELCSLALDSGAVPQRASQRSHLQVCSSLETLLDLVGAPAGEMESAGVIAGATVRRTACDATITRVLLNTRSQVIDVGRSERVVSGATRRALNIRDQGCRWPGCERTASWTAAHHVVHWTRGGPTNVDNLVLLCRHHHWTVHEGGWQLVRTDDGTIVTVSPLVGPRSPLREPAMSATGAVPTFPLYVQRAREPAAALPA